MENFQIRGILLTYKLRENKMKNSKWSFAAQIILLPIFQKVEYSNS